MLIIVLMGGPGAGKGTQARRLAEALDIPHIASGDLFREHLSRNTDLAKVAKKYIDAGDLVPDDVTVAMVEERLTRQDCENGALLDGFPRTIYQAKELKRILAKQEAEVSIVPCIDVPEDVLLKRLAGRWTCKAAGHVYHELFYPPVREGICDIDGSLLYQREDDTLETQRNRIKVYIEQTKPLIDYYYDEGLLVPIDGDQPIDEVYNDLLRAIKEKQTPVRSKLGDDEQ